MAALLRLNFIVARLLAKIKWGSRCADLNLLPNSLARLSMSSFPGQPFGALDEFGLADKLAAGVWTSLPLLCPPGSVPKLLLDLGIVIAAGQGSI